MTSLLEAIRIVKDPRPEPTPIRETDRPQIEDRKRLLHPLCGLDPETIEREASEAAAAAPHGHEGWRKAASLLVAYSRLYARYQVDLEDAERYRELMNMPAPMTPHTLERLIYS